MCTRCKETKSLSCFTVDNHIKGGLSIYCKFCLKVKQDKRRYTLTYLDGRPLRKVHTLDVKRCSKCHKKKTLSNFSKNVSTPDGLQDRCNYCSNYTKWKKRNPKKNEEDYQEYLDIKALRKSETLACLKYCPRCKITKAFSDFGKTNSRKSGLVSWCKKCITYKNTWGSGALFTMKKRMKKRGLSCTISIEELSTFNRETPNVCHYCGINISPDAPGIINGEYRACKDRRDNNDGYKLTNMVKSCSLCNSIKWASMSYEEAVRVLPIKATEHRRRKGIPCSLK